MYNEEDTQRVRELVPRARVVRSVGNGLDQRLIDRARALPVPPLNATEFEARTRRARTFVTIGRLAESRHTLVLPALKALTDEGVPLLWVVIGGGPHATVLAAEVEALKLQDAVWFAGPQFEESRIAYYMTRGEFFLYDHDIGLSLNHAFGYGLPVITHDDDRRHGPEMTIFREGVNGITYERGSRSALIAALRYALSLPESARREMGERNLHLVQHHYNTERMASNFADFVEDVTADPS